MSNTRDKRRTGLGAEAFFKNTPPPKRPAESETTTPADDIATQQVEAMQPETQDSGKVRTTVNLYPNTLALLETLKIQAKKRREKFTFGDILDEAIRDLAQKKGVSI